LLERFRTDVPIGKVVFPTNVHLTTAAYREMLLGANRIPVTRLIGKTTHHTWCYGHVYQPKISLAHISLK
jgi:hypothetical protein